MALSRWRWLQGRRVIIMLAGLTLLALALSAPESLGETYDRGRFYLFSRAFFDDIPGRLSGPGRFRFVLQPLAAIVLGIRSGMADERAGRPPYLYAVLFNRNLRGELVRSGFANAVKLLLMSILMDVAFQWVILGVSHPGVALVVGSSLILLPYALARALSNRLAGLRKDSRPSLLP